MAPNGRRESDSKTDSEGRLRRRSRDPIQTRTYVQKATGMGLDTENTDNTDRRRDIEFLPIKFRVVRVFRVPLPLNMPLPAFTIYAAFSDSAAWLSLL